MNEADALPPWLAPGLNDLLHQRGHAWLLHGPSGLGQYAFALALARAWLCERQGQADPAQAGGAQDGPQAMRAACGECPSCHAIDVRTHADLRVLMPETLMLELHWPIDEKAQSELDAKKRKPSREIRVDAMRDAVDFTQQTSARGRGKAVLIYPAERMNAITANTLLKTLEEPVGDVRFILASEAAWQLLPTIRSRCISYALPWPDSQQASAWLAAQGVPVADVGVWLRAAGGRAQDALVLARSGVSVHDWARLPKLIARGGKEALDALAARSPAQVIGVLQKVCHDLFATGQGAAPRFFEAADLPNAPPPGALEGWWRSLAGEARTAEHPFNAPLMLEALVSQAQSILSAAARRR
ncbi:MAG: DNA polymerase III subunit delta' [Burkholderiaceae bacterium]|jgi:DNA polymerase-3 subunit delta'|nr:DNA polymerase III subunit delta' [Burkholderiaceae bacterium]